MRASVQGTAEPDLEVPLLFNIQDEMLSVFKDANIKAANHTVNATSADFAVCALLPVSFLPCHDPHYRPGSQSIAAALEDCTHSHSLKQTRMRPERALATVTVDTGARAVADSCAVFRASLIMSC